MGSDLYMNPPEKVYEWHEVELQDTVTRLLWYGLNNGWEVQVHKAGHFYKVGIFKGEWR